MPCQSEFCGGQHGQLKLSLNESRDPPTESLRHKTHGPGTRVGLIRAGFLIAKAMNASPALAMPSWQEEPGVSFYHLNFWAKTMAFVSFKINELVHTVDVDPETPLLYVLSDELQLRGPKFGCGLGQCGACTVIIRGRAVRSCVMPVSAVKDQAITTLEGLGTPERPHAIQQAFIDEGAAQCGFCLSGVILTAKALLDENPDASVGEIEEAMSNVLCRCFTHTRMMRAIKRYQRSRV